MTRPRSAEHLALCVGLVPRAAARVSSVGAGDVSNDLQARSSIDERLIHGLPPLRAIDALSRDSRDRLRHEVVRRGQGKFVIDGRLTEASVPKGGGNELKIRVNSRERRIGGERGPPVK